jgi:hypothetical protein
MRIDSLPTRPLGIPDSPWAENALSSRPCSGLHLEWRQQGLDAPPAVELHSRAGLAEREHAWSPYPSGSACLDPVRSTVTAARWADLHSGRRRAVDAVRNEASVGEPKTLVFVLIARRMEPERSGSSSQRPLGLSSRVAFCYLRSVLPVSSKGRLSARVPEVDGSHPVPQGERDPLWSKLATHSISEPIKHCKDDYLRLPRRRWTASFECAALAMISPALRAKPLSSTGATSALDFNERFAEPCRTSEGVAVFFFRPWTIRPLALLTQTPAPEISFHVPLSRSIAP